VNHVKSLEHTEKIKEYIYKVAFKGEINNKDLVQIIEVIGNDLLNLQTISEYAKQNNMTYNGVKYNRNVITLFGNKYVLDNN
jgi:hypothetical protein